MTKYNILDKRVLDEDDNYRDEVQLCENNGIRMIRFCYYTKRHRKDGSDYWNIAPRSLHVNFDEAGKLVDIINELIENNKE